MSFGVPYRGGTKMVRNDWFTECRDKNGDIRVLFFRLLRDCLGMDSFNSNIYCANWPAYINDWSAHINARPFINKFKENKKEERVFTKTVIGQFVFLCTMRNKDNINEYTNKAVNILKKSKYALDLQEYDSCSSVKCKQDAMLTCMEKIKGQQGFSDQCENCTVAWLYRNLKYIEENYDRIISHKNILLKYSDREQESLIEDIYKEIKEYEKLPLDKRCDISRLRTLFNSCIKSYSIPDVADEKLAYVKWYTAHLSNWPFFKACLLHANHYDEFSIYQMLRSASDILQIIESNNEALLTAVECDRIVSFLTLGYISPFTLYYCGNPDDIENNCLKSLQKIAEPCYRYRIYLLLWKLHSHLNKNDLTKYEKEIDTIYNQNSDNAEISLLNIEYMLYRYHYDLGNRNTVKKEIVSLVKKFKNNGTIPESLDIISELFYNYDQKNSPNEDKNDNPAVLYLELKGRQNFDSHTFIIPSKSSEFHRIFSEYTLSQSSGPLPAESYYETRRKEIMDHYSLWSSDSE